MWSVVRTSRLDEVNVWLWFYLALMFVGVGAVVFAQVVAGWERETCTIPIHVFGITPHHIELIGVVLTIIGGFMACLLMRERDKELEKCQNKEQ